jgi:antirestriction protein ArdC
MPEKRPPLDIYRAVTDAIVAAIEAGVGPVELPWHRHAASGLPVNVHTGNTYRGVNVLALWAAATVRGFGSNLWGTYRQWRKMEAQVRGGERAALIVFYKELPADEDEETAEVKPRPRRVARASWVFNADQVDGYAPPDSPLVDRLERVHAVERFVAGTEADIRHGGYSAYYDPSTDHIQMPEPSSFTGTTTQSPTEGYYGVLLHELVHWSGAPHRLARDLSARFGSAAYAMEELVAEIGSAFLCATLHVTPTPRPDHAAYVGHWLTVLKSDKRAIFVAASKAMEAADYLG